MDIKFLLTLNNYVDFNLYHIKHSKVMKRTLFTVKYVVPLVFLICGSMLYYLLSDKGNVRVYFYIVLCTVIYILIFSKMYVSQIRKSVTKLVNEGNTADLLGEQTISLKDDYLENQTVGGCEQLKYNMIERIEIDEECMYIYKNSITAFIVPFSAFSTQEEKDKFMNILKDKTNSMQ